MASHPAPPSPHRLPLPSSPLSPHSPGPLRLHQESAERFLQSTIDENCLEAFYPSPTVERLAKELALPDALGKVDKLAEEWKLEKMMALDLVKLSLYDVVVLLDDSSRLASNPEAVEDLAVILARITTATSLIASSSGTAIRFVNADISANGVKSPSQAVHFLKGAGKKAFGSNPLATSLQKKVLRPLVLGPASSSPSHLEKPVLVIVVTGSPPSGEPINLLPLMLSQASQILDKRSRYGAGACALQFGVVGSEPATENALKAISEGRGSGAAGGHPGRIGVDVTWGYDREAALLMRQGGFDLTPELWLLKLLMGAIDKSYRDH